MIYLYWVLAFVAALGFAAIFIPESASTTGTAHFDANIETVWSVYTDFASQPEWREDVVSVEFKDGEREWVETVRPGNIKIHFRVDEFEPPTRLVLAMESPGVFQGSYTATFEKSENGTKGVFTESSTSLSFFSKVMRFVFVSQAALIDKYSEEARSEIARRNGNLHQTP